MFVVASAAFSQLAAAETVLWSDAFDDGGAASRWSVSAGTWQIGIPASGPGAAYSGLRCAGTNLGGNYPNNANTRLERVVSFVVPAASEHPRLRFWHWFSINGGDSGVVQIKPAGGNWSILGPEYDVNSASWTRTSLDLSAYESQEVELAFYFASGSSGVSSGWYIDEVAVVTGTPVLPNPEGFERGLGDWSADRGIWQVGTTTTGPGSAFSGTRCAATVLDGNYPYYVRSRLISPSFTVPAASENPRFRFWHWFSINGGDSGVVQIRPAGGNWSTLGPVYDVNSGPWTRTSLDLSAYAGQEVELAFYFQSSSNSSGSSGWYIDEVAVVTGAPLLPNPDGFESGLGNWSADRGTWQVGPTTTGPGSAFSGTQCAATVLDGNYPSYVRSRLISPSFTVPAASENPRLRFWHWFRINGGDSGVVQIKPAGGNWSNLGPAYDVNSGPWTRTSLDLSAYAGQEVELAFYFQSSSGSSGNFGWYIDEVAVVTGAPLLPNPDGFESGLGNWSADRGTWQVGPTTTGPGSAFSGTRCAATVLDGNYPHYVRSRLISPSFNVPAVSEHPRFRFWHWFSINGGDSGVVQIRPVGGNWSALGPVYDVNSGPWTRTSLDLSAYAGQEVELAFYFQSSSSSSGSSGWYIDNIEITSDTLDAIPSVYGHPEGTPLTFTAQATGSNLIFSLAPGAPAGATIHPTTGAFSWTPTEQQGPGVYDITVLVNQVGNNLSPLASSKFTVQVTEVNNAPVLNPIGPQTVNEGSPLAFTATATDPDNTNIANPTILTSANFDDLTFGTWTTYNVASNKNWGTEDFNGQYAWIFGLGANVASNDWLISPALKLDAGTVRTLRFQSQREYAGPDLAVLVSTNYTGTGNPTAATWTALTPLLPSADSSEEWTDSGVLNLAAFTGPKVYVAFRYTTTGTTTGTARLWRVDDIEIRGPAAVPPPQTLTYSLGAGAPAGVGIDPLTGQFTWTPTEGQAPGVYPVTIIVTDNGTNPPNQSTSEIVQITVREVNEPPTLAAITDKTVNEGTLLTFTAAGSDTDVPANPLTYTLDAGAPDGAAIGSSTGEFTWTPTEAQGPGTYSITVRVTDSSPDAVNATSLSATRTFDVTVNEVNEPPALAVITNKTVDAGMLLTFTAVGSDSDIPANPLTYSLDAGAPAGATIDPGTGVFTWTPTVPGSYSITVRVTDSSPDAVNAKSLSTPQTFAVEVMAGSNHPPELAAIPAQTVNEGSLLTFTAAATDADLPGDTLTYSLIGAPAGAAINPVTGVFAWTPTEEQGPGPFTFTVQVSDSALATDDQTVSVTVNEVNVAPVLAAISNKTVNEETELRFTFSATDADLPANTLTYSFDPPGAPIIGPMISPSGEFSWTPTEAEGPGVYSFTVRVTDSSPDAVNAKSLSDTMTFTVTVNEVNLPPVLAAIPNKVVDEGALLTFTALGSDTDLPANALNYSLGAGAPTGAAIDPTTGVFSWTPTEAQGPGIYPITVQVTDSSPQAVNATSLSASRTFEVTVNEVDDFAAWRRGKFGNDVDDPAKEATVWGDLADPDQDGTPNVIEFMTVREPLVADPELGPQFRLENGKAIMTYRETKLTDHDVFMFGTWSADLTSWLYAGLEYVQIGDEGDHYLMEIRLPVNRQRRLFMRLEALR